MNLLELQTILNQQFDSETEELSEKSGCEISRFNFISENQNKSNEHFDEKSNLLFADVLAKNHTENSQFEYHVFVPKQREKKNGIIILMHGLNEKGWEKYLTWAHYLTLNTGKAVLLFPIANHMDRTPKNWSNPREMLPLVKIRKSGNFIDSSFLNAALSYRLDQNPENFLHSGIQTINDIVELCSVIKSGKHKLFERDCSIDFFGYSIGAFLSQTLFIANPKQLFSKAKLFIFCGGLCFDRMDGRSKFIMDNGAAKRLRETFVFLDINKLYQKMFANNTISIDKNLWKSFVLMLNKKHTVKKRERFFRKRANDIAAALLKRDAVMPYGAVLDVLHGQNGDIPISVDIFDFSFPASHEVPFPIKQNETLADVEQGFKTVFDRAVSFLK